MKTILIFFLGLFIFNKAFSQIIVSKNGDGNFITINDAIRSVPDNSAKKVTIFIKKGLYREKVIIPSSKINVELIGEDKATTVISFDDYNPKVKGNDTINTWTSFTFSAEAEGFIARNLTFENTAGKVGQAVAVKVLADQVIFINCIFLGNQDTLFAHGIGRIYFKDCYIEGTTDFIFGSAIALFENCTIHSKEDSYITAASTPKGNNYGFVFKNCVLTADSGINHVYLGRPWRANAKTVFINCNLGHHILPVGWHNWNDVEKEKTTFYAEFNSSGKGSNLTERVPWAKQLTVKEAENYTCNKIFARSSVPIPVVGSWNIENIIKKQ